MANSPKLGFARISDSQAGAGMLANGDFNLLEMIAQGSVINRTTAAPPGSPSEGDCYIVAASGTGLWLGQDKKLAAYYNGWIFIAPTVGFEIWNVGAQAWSYFDGTSWSEQTVSSRTTGISAAGTTQGTATALVKDVNFVTSATGGSADGVVLPTAPSVGSNAKVIVNRSTATLKIYPSSGGQIDALGSNAAYSLATLKTLVLFSQSTTQWFSLLSA